MNRTTRKDLDDAATLLTRATDVEHFIQVQDGHPRLLRSHGDGVDNVSPRLPAPQLIEWLRAYLSGLDQGLKIATERLRPRCNGDTP